MEVVKSSFNFPANLWRRVRLKSVQEGVSSASVVIELLERWVKGEIKLNAPEKEKLAA